MPDHIHVLIEGTHACCDEDTMSVVRYIFDNPVRARLVADAADYPYLGSTTVRVRHLLYSVQL